MSDVLINAKSLKLFFLGYKFDNNKENKICQGLLEYVPISCHYEFNPETMVSELTSSKPAIYPLSYHMQVIFCDRCEIRVSLKYYNSLGSLANIQSKLLGFERRLQISWFEQLLFTLRLV